MSRCQSSCRCYLQGLLRKMGACLSTSTRSTCSSRSNGEARRPLSSTGFTVLWMKGTKRAFSDHAMTLQHLGSIPNRVFANGKSSSSCIFTQQGRKGINQDAMLVREDFMTEDKLKSMKDGSADEDQLNSMWSLVSYYVILTVVVIPCLRFGCSWNHFTAYFHRYFDNNILRMLESTRICYCAYNLKDKTVGSC